MGSLKSFIKSIRKAKTIADERAVVRKESAAIRTAFRDALLDQTQRRINISKLLYLYIMGEKTHFGQVECLKVLSSPRFADKRLGYLATLLFLDEQTEVLTLLTNSLDNDLQHHNAYIVGLALCCLGNVALPELARDLHANVEQILASNNAYLRKKAALVAARLVDKDPDLAEYFAPKIPELLSEKSPGPLIATTRLVRAVYDASPDHRGLLVRQIPKLIDHLRRVATSGYMPDYDVHGITDPFLQVALLTTLRVLATDEAGKSYVEPLNDVLTQVASNLEPGRNAAHAVLYECVKTIFAVDADQLLRVLGVNILGKFLATKDNNTKYVALDSLLTVMGIEPQAVQRHRATIVACLSDGDVSIRRRALELTFLILTEQNVRVLVRELLAFMERSADADLKPYVAAQLTQSAAKYAPNAKWHFDTMVRMLRVAGNSVSPDIVSSVLALLLRCDDSELKRYVVGRLSSACWTDPSQYGLALVAVWALGEYGELVVGQEIEQSKESDGNGDNRFVLTEMRMVELLRRVVDGATFLEQERTVLVTYVLTSALKMSVRFTSSETIEALRRILNDRTYDNNLEIQVRAVEYQEIFAQDAKLRRGLLAHMPAPPIKEREAVLLHGNRAQKPAKKDAPVDDLLLDLMGDAPKSTTSEILDLFSAPGSLGGAAPARSEATPVTNILTGSATPSAHSSDAVLAFSNDILKVYLQNVEFSSGQCAADVVVELGSEVEQFQLLVAVPKTQKLTITLSGGDHVGPGQPVRQSLKVAGKAGAKVKLRVKVKYVVGGAPHEDQFDYGGFTSVL